MQQFGTQVTEADLPTASEVRKHEPLTRSGWLAWAVIVLVTLGMFALTAIAQSMLAKEGSNEASAADLMPIEMQGKMLVGQKNFLRTVSSSDEMDDPSPGEDAHEGNDNREVTDFQTATQLPDQLDVGSYEQRLCFALLLNELEGVERAKEHLELTDDRAKSVNLELSEDQTKLRDTVGALLTDYALGDKDGTNVDRESKELLSERLGWVGELGLVPSGTSNQQAREEILDEASQAMLVMIGGMVMGIIMLIAGLFVVILLLVLCLNGAVRSRFQNQRGRHNIYAETFAIWLIVFFGMQLCLPVMLNVLQLDSPLIQLGMMPPLFFGSLLVLAWPVLRGVRFSDVRADIGWKFGNPFVEGSLGGLAYLGILPALFVALISVVVMMSLMGPAQSSEVFTKGSGPSHPIQEYLADGGLPLAGLVILTACVAAPIVEETMFRGVLYRHLRDWTGSQNRFVSIGVSSILNSLIFAAIHPQGVFGIPLLMTLAIGFSLAREWRSSLFGPMVMHGINNLTVTMFLFVLL